MTLGTIRIDDFRLNLINNAISDVRKIKAFSKEEILEVKQKIKKLTSEKAEQYEIDDFLKTKFSYEEIQFYSHYLDNLKQFTEHYLIPKHISGLNFSNSNNFKSEIIKELKFLSINLANLSSNGRNVKRFLKKNKYLDEYTSKVKTLAELIQVLSSDLENSIGKDIELYDDDVHLWVETNKIKNPYFRLNPIPDLLENWGEIRQLYTFIDSLNQAKDKIKRKRKTERPLTFQFDEIQQYFLEKKDGKIWFYLDLMYFLYLNKVIVEYEGDKYINILERKGIAKKLKKLTETFIKQLTENLFKNILNEFAEIAKSVNYEDKEKQIDLKTVFKQNFNIFTPKILDYSLLVLDSKYHSILGSKSEEMGYNDTLTAYFEDVERLYSLITNLEDWLLRFETFLKPFDRVTISYKKTLSNITSEIERRRNEYELYLKTIKNENLRIDLREYIDNKISELNEITRFYEDDTSLILKEELPQLKKVRQILNNYKSNVQKIKEEVYKKLDVFKEKDIDLYHIIRKWENNFNLKRKQLSFLLSLMLNKLFRSFKDLIEEEATVFANITEITNKIDDFKVLPLNFALSSFLAEKLTEQELKERAIEIKSKINQLNDSIKLYQDELSKLEKIIEHRVKTREGIADSSVSCTVCHNSINFSRDNIISCPYCGSVYHYLCVAYWLSNHNSCPMCLNNFVNFEMFES